MIKKQAPSCSRCHASAPTTRTLTLWNRKPQRNTFFYQLPWSWCFITTENDRDTWVLSSTRWKEVSQQTAAWLSKATHMPSGHLAVEGVLSTHSIGLPGLLREHLGPIGHDLDFVSESEWFGTSLPTHVSVCILIRGMRIPSLPRITAGMDSDMQRVR